MEKVREPYFQVLYNNLDITTDVSRFLISLSYLDKVEGESDELELVLEDTDGLWRGPWYPEKGASLEAVIGYDNERLPCGTFEIDEIELTGAPDTVTIRALATGISGTLRTVRSDAHEGKTLRQIAAKVAQRNGLTVEGTIPEVRFERVTQSRETDLSFLRRISKDYGCLFSVRGKQLVFTTVFELEAAQAVTEIDRLQIARFSIKDTSTRTYKEAEVRYHNPKTNTVSKGKHKFEVESYAATSTGDVKVIHTKAENRQQAELKAKAALHAANSKQQEGSFTAEGNPLLVSGVNFELTGFGKVSGTYHITESRHSINKSSGYVCECAIKRVGFVEEGKQASTTKDSDAVARLRQPSNVQVVPGSIDTENQLKNNPSFTGLR